MRIAMLSPVAWRTPPEHYGPWELVVSLITEGLVQRGLDQLVADAAAEGAPADRLLTRAVHNLADAGVVNVAVRRAPVEAALDALAGSAPDVLVLDPPRRGLPPIQAGAGREDRSS